MTTINTSDTTTPTILSTENLNDLLAYVEALEYDIDFMEKENKLLSDKNEDLGNMVMALRRSIGAYKANATRRRAQTVRA